MLPSQTSVPRPVVMQQSAAPTPSPVPPRPPPVSVPPSGSGPSTQNASFRKPKLLLEIRDLSRKGARDFLTAIEAGTVVEEYVGVILRLLYSPGSTIPPTRSVTLVVHSAQGLAYTTGKELDQDHKEIHISMNYLESVPPERRRLEILGVLTHELVHCFQWTANGTIPGGLCEGIADWVRLSCGLAPPHWSRKADGNWDAGYQDTAYFLDYLEDRFGHGSVRRINQHLNDCKYEEKTFWPALFNHSVHRLWDDYKKYLEKESERKNPDGAANQKVIAVVHHDRSDVSEGSARSDSSTDNIPTPTTSASGEEKET